MAAQPSRARIEIQLKIPDQKGLASKTLRRVIEKRLLLLLQFRKLARDHPHTAGIARRKAPTGGLHRDAGLFADLQQALAWLRLKLTSKRHKAEGTHA